MFTPNKAQSENQCFYDSAWVRALLGTSSSWVIRAWYCALCVGHYSVLSVMSSNQVKLYMCEGISQKIWTLHPHIALYRLFDM